MKRSALLTAACAALALLAGCATAPSPGAVTEIARPDAAPTRAVTRFDEALMCMDQQFADYGVQGVSIAVSGVPDYTGRAFVGSDIWLQGAINRMSQQSRAFVVTDFNPNPGAPEQSLWAMLKDNQRFYVPAYYIRGAVSGFADQVAVNNATGALGAVKFDVGAGQTNASSIVSVDLSVAELAQRTLISRASTGNEIVLQSRTTGAQVGGRLAKLGANLELTFSRADGVPQAVRALVELGAIEILGRLTGTPYWECLGASHSAPDAQRIRREVHGNMSVPERVVFAQRRLARLGDYQGQLDGVASPALNAAIASYAAKRGITPAAADSFALYDRLTLWRADQAGAAPAVSAVAPAQPAMLPAPGPAKPPVQPLSLNIFLQTSGAPGAAASLRLNTTREAYTYCYLQEQSGAVLKVFPNRWQPDPLVRPQQGLSLPAPDAGFQLVLPQPGAQEKLVCLASSEEIARKVSPALLGPDLTPLPARSLDDVVAAFRKQADARGAGLVVQSQTLAAR